MEVTLIYTGDDDSSTLRYPKLIESRQITWKEILDEPILFRASKRRMVISNVLFRRFRKKCFSVLFEIYENYLNY